MEKGSEPGRGQREFTYEGKTNHPTSDVYSAVSIAECKLCCGRSEVNPIDVRLVNQLQLLLQRHGNTILFFKSPSRTMQLLNWAESSNVTFEIRLWRRVWLSPRYLHSDELMGTDTVLEGDVPKCEDRDRHSHVSITYCQRRKAYTCFHCGRGFICMFNILLWRTDQPSLTSSVGGPESAFLLFPRDVWVKILFNLSLQELAAVSQVCRFLYHAARNRYLLRLKLSTTFPHPEKLIAPLLSKRFPFCVCESSFIKHRHCV